METRKALRVGFEKEKVLRAMSGLRMAIMDLENALDDSEYEISKDLAKLSERTSDVMMARAEKPWVVRK